MWRSPVFSLYSQNAGVIVITNYGLPGEVTPFRKVVYFLAGNDGMCVKTILIPGSQEGC